MKISVIIPTKNRPEELKSCLKSISRQTKRPDEIIIVYAGSQPDVKGLTELIGKIKLRFFRNQKMIMTHGKNIGLNKAIGDIIFIFDDDVIVQKNYLRETAKIFQDDPQRKIGIVVGSITNTPKQSFEFFQKIFLLAGEGCYRVLPSGANVINNRGAKNTKEVDWASGCAMAIRRKVAQEFKVNEQYDLFSYGLGEDLDYSWRVGKRYKIIFNPRSRLKHIFSQRGRINDFLYGFIYVINREYFVNKNMNSFYHYVCFYWSIFGWLLGNIVGIIKTPIKNLLIVSGGTVGLLYLISTKIWQAVTE